MLGLNRHDIFRHLNDAARADEFFWIDLVDTLGPVDKMVWRIDVRPRVDAKGDVRHIRR